MSHIITTYPRLPVKGNHTIRGKRVPVSDWRSLVHWFGSGRCGLDLQRREALLQVARQFDGLLHRPLDRFDVDDCAAVEVFGQIIYTIDQELLELGAGMRDRAGRPEPLPVNVCLLPALKGTNWLALLLDAWCVPWRSGEGDSFLPRDAQEALFLRTLRRLLDADCRFRFVRRAIGPLLLGAGLVQLALRSRVGEFDSDHVQLVWRHEGAFAEVARVHPKLLPVLTLLLRAGALDGDTPPTAADVLRRMRAALAARLPAPAWRWLILHGVRFVADLGDPRLELDAMVAVLSELAACDFPPPPASRFMQAWRSLNGKLECTGAWCSLPKRIRRVLLAEAARRAALPGFADWCAEAERVMFAITTPGDKVADLPKRCGYAWLKRRAAEIERREQRRHAVAGLQWESPLCGLRVGNRQVVPLTSGVEMFDEAMFMRSCLADFAMSCSEGRALVFSVRDEQGRPVANLLYRRDAHARWEFVQARRRFNRLPGQGLLRLAEAVGGLLQSTAAANFIFQLDPEAS